MQFIIFFFTASAKISSVSVPLLCISFFPFFLLFLIGKYPITLMYTKKKTNNNIHDTRMQTQNDLYFSFPAADIYFIQSICNLQS